MNSIGNGLLLFAFILTGYASWVAFMGGRWRNNKMIDHAERCKTNLKRVSNP